jgi:hypothetical protein
MQNINNLGGFPGAGGPLNSILNSDDPTVRKEQLVYPPSGYIMLCIGVGLVVVGVI